MMIHPQNPETPAPESASTDDQNNASCPALPARQRQSSRFLSLFCLSIVVISPSAQAAVQLSGEDIDHRPFKGWLVGVAEDSLTLALDPLHPEQTRSIAIPSIARMEWQADPEEDTGPVLNDLIRASPAWAALDSPSLLRLLGLLEAAIERGAFMDGYHHSSRLLELPLDAETRLRASILKVWALDGLHMPGAAGEVLDELLRQVPALHAPIRLCWIAARILLQGGHTEAARRWAAIPFLQIPTASGPLADDLRAVALYPDLSR